jgi:hypothetical protein
MRALRCHQVRQLRVLLLTPSVAPGVLVFLQMMHDIAKWGVLAAVVLLAFAGSVRARARRRRPLHPHHAPPTHTRALSLSRSLSLTHTHTRAHSLTHTH